MAPRVRLSILLLSLLWLGLATTVATAWFFAVLVDPKIGTNRLTRWSQPSRGEHGAWRVIETSARGRHAFVLWSASTEDRADGGPLEEWPRRALPRWSAGRLPPTAMAQVPTPSTPVIELSTGWPLIALRYTRLPPDLPLKLPSESLRGGIDAAGVEPPGIVVRPAILFPINWGSSAETLAGRRLRASHALPLIPTWWGLVVNTLLYAGVALVATTVLAAPRHLIRRRRRRRGRCERCAYPLPRGSTAPCPECGTAPGDRSTRPMVSETRIALALAALATAAPIVVAAPARSRLDAPSRLTVAARWNDIDRLSRELARGASPDGDAPDNWAWPTPLGYASAHGNDCCVRLLLDAGAEIDRSAWRMDTALALAARYGHAATVELLLERGSSADGGADTIDPFMTAARGRHPDLVERLLAAGVVPTSSDLQWAAIDSCPKCLTLMWLAAPAEAHAAGWQCLILAGQRGRLDTLDRLLDLGADPVRPQWPRTLLHEIRSGNSGDAAVLAIIQRLVAAGLDIDARCDAGNTPLILATWRGDAGVVAALLAAGADSHATDAHGRRAVDFAETPQVPAVGAGPHWRLNPSRRDDRIVGLLRGAMDGGDLADDRSSSR